MAVVFPSIAKKKKKGNSELYSTASAASFSNTCRRSLYNILHICFNITCYRLIVCRWRMYVYISWRPCLELRSEDASICTTRSRYVLVLYKRSHSDFSSVFVLGHSIEVLFLFVHSIQSLYILLYRRVSFYKYKCFRDCIRYILLYILCSIYFQKKATLYI